MNQRIPWVGMVVGMAWIVIVAAIAFLVLTQSRDHRTPCLSHLKQVATAQLMYASDADDILPDATKWVDLTVPYLKIYDFFRCTELPPGDYGFAMNGALSRRKAPYEGAEKTLLLFESTDTGKNAHGGLTIYASPGRHAGRSNVAYADGHVRTIALGRRP